MPKKIRFDLSCFKNEFQKFIFESINIKDYYEFINVYENKFELELNCLDCGIKLENKDISENTENTENIEELKSEKLLINLLPVDEDCSFNNIEKESTSDNDSIEEYSSDEDTKELTSFSFTIDNNNILLKNENKVKNKKMLQLLKKNGGKWMKKKKYWLFPLSSKPFIESIVNQDKLSKIKEVKQEPNKVLIIPENDHPKMGVSIIYDKSGNIGVWDNELKGWVFNKN